MCVENRAAIEQWRATVDPAKLRRYNHPSCVWQMWSRATGLGKAPRAAERPAKGGGAARVKRPYAGNRPICFDQEMVRRAGNAMRESRSSDWFRLATIALSAAIRDRGDLALLNDGAKSGASTAAVHLPAQTFPVINIAR